MKRLPGEGPGQSVITGAAVAAIITAVPGIGILCSCLFGLPGILGAFFCTRGLLKRGFTLTGGQGAWYGLYSAALGTIFALFVFILIGFFKVDYEQLKPMLDEWREIFIQQGLTPEEARKKIEELKPTIILLIRWHPLIILAINACAGALTGAFTVFLSARRKDGNQDQGSLPSSSSMDK